jgi:hypothetical protein
MYDCDIFAPFNTEISLFSDKISSNSDISVPNDVEISLTLAIA